MADSTEIKLSAIVAAGATLDGCRVRRAVFELEDGRRVAADLPSQGTMTCDLSESQSRTLGTLRGSELPLTRKVLATRLRFASPGGRFGQDIKTLVEKGLIVERDGYLTDDATKMPQTET
jgi:hypothetical protein